MSIDWTTPAAGVAATYLRTLPVAWFTTVGADHTPYPSVVWFWWDGGDILIFSQPNTLKLRNITSRPRVALALQNDPLGEAFAIVTGQARVDKTHPGAADHDGYRAKYQHLMRHVLGWTPAEFAESYSVPILLTASRLR